MYVSINTALDPFSYAISDGKQTLVENKQRSSREFTEQLIYHIENSLSEQGLSFDSLRGIGVVSGPGSYTGLRIGISTAKTIAMTQGIPIYHCTTLQALAWQLGKTDHIKFIVIPARKNEVTLQLFEAGERAEAISEPVSYDLEQMTAFIQSFDQPIHLYGQCSDAFKTLFAEEEMTFHELSLSTATLCKWAEKNVNEGKDSSFASCKPFYFYEPVIGKAKGKAKRRK